jgi:hypothetical protein
MTRYWTNFADRKLPAAPAAKTPTAADESDPVNIKTAAWPGLPGKGGPDRSNGVKKTGSMGDFYPYAQFSPPKLGTGERFANLKSKLASEPGVTDPGALAASIGRKKYGKARFQNLAAKGQPGY